MDLRAAFEVQQDLAEASVLRCEVVWDVLGPDQSEILAKKLDYMFPEDKGVYTSKKDLRKSRKHNTCVKKIKDKLYNSIWNQRKYTNGVLLHSVIYVLVTPDLNMNNAKCSHTYSIHPVFRTRRCLRDNVSSGCCMIFVDDQSRAYNNWSDFVNNNELPSGIMIAPKNGCYSLDNENKVVLEFSFTPGYSSQALSTLDKVISIASVVGQLSAMFHPVLAIFPIGTKTYQTIRDYQIMSDKVNKGTTTKLAANLSLTSNIISLTSSVGTFAAQMSVATGEKLSLTTEVSLQTINCVAGLTNCTKLIITTYDLFTRYFLDEEELDFADFCTFSSSLLLFTNSLNNIAITSQIGTFGGNGLRSLLQSKIKAGLALISKEMIKYADQNAGGFDLLRLVNDIPYKDVLCNIHTIYTHLTKSGFLATFSVVSAVAMEVTPGLLVQIVNKEITDFDLKELSEHYGSKFVEHIANYNNFIDVLNGIGAYFTATIVKFLLNQTLKFIETALNEIDSQLIAFITTEMILYKMLSHIIKSYKDYTYAFLDMKSDEILLAVKNFFIYLNPNTIAKNVERHNCSICGGYYYLENN